LRQIGIGFAIYVSDHNFYPSGFRVFGHSLSREILSPPPPTTPVSVSIGGGFDDVHRLFMCPARNGGSFGYNHYGIGGSQRVAEKLPVLGLGLEIWGLSTEVMRLGGPHPESQVVVPSDMIAFGDIKWEGALGMSISGIGTPQVQISMLLPPSPQFAFDYHRTGANVAFCDGHVEFGTRRRFDTKQDDVRRRWNSDNDPHPEYWK
jgi:prepilin-type processing-associated H-X9-DG protein